MRCMKTASDPCGFWPLSSPEKNVVNKILLAGSEYDCNTCNKPYCVFTSLRN